MPRVANFAAPTQGVSGDVLFDLVWCEGVATDKVFGLCLCTGVAARCPRRAPRAPDERPAAAGAGIRARPRARARVRVQGGRAGLMPVNELRRVMSWTAGARCSPALSQPHARGPTEWLVDRRGTHNNTTRVYKQQENSISHTRNYIDTRAHTHTQLQTQHYTTLHYITLHYTVT